MVSAGTPAAIAPSAAALTKPLVPHMNGGAMADHRQERHEAGSGADQQHWAVIDRPPHEVTSQRPLKINGSPTRAI
jgi:hypothetical protein